jgi:hypothetical protein
LHYRLGKNDDSRKACPEQSRRDAKPAKRAIEVGPDIFFSVQKLHLSRLIPFLSPGCEKRYLQAAQKDLRGEAREKSTSGGVLRQYVGARRLSATKDMSLFQQPASPIRFA